MSCFVFQLAILEISWIRSRLGQIQVKVLEKSKQVLEKSKQVLEKTMSGGRGGPRHQPKPWIDVGLLYDCLKKHEKEPSCLTAVAGKLTRLQYQAPMEGLKKLKLSNEDQLGKAPANKKLGKAHAAQEDLLGKAGASKRQLVPRDSDVEGGKGGKMHLIVEISAKMTPHYKALIGKIREALEKDNLTKEEALSMRAKLLEQYGS